MLFHLFSFEIQPILEFQDQTGHTYFWPHPFLKFKEPIFGPFPHFLGQKKFFKKNQVVMHNFIKVSSTLAKTEI